MLERGVEPDVMAGDLLKWYDLHARVLPWRVGPADRAAGVRPDPYAVWLSEIMLQQTTVAAVRAYFLKFVARWPRVSDLAGAADADVMAAWAGLGYYARARNLVACARRVSHFHAGRFPDTEPGLRELPGVGPYTAAAIAAIAFERPAVVVDGNVERVMARVHSVEASLPAAKPELRRLARRLTLTVRPGDYAQAVMDLGATVCTPRAPACGICPWRASCLARAAGIAQELPRRVKKLPKPVRHGAAYVAMRGDGAVLVERRPAMGLLGGMLSLPGTEWTEGQPLAAPPFRGAWRECSVEVRHTFTHFHLRLRVLALRTSGEAVPANGEFHSASVLDGALPTVMLKALRVGLATLEAVGKSQD